MQGLLRRSVPLLSLSLVLSAPLMAQAPGRWGCTVDSLSGFNCAQYYNGTVTQTSELKGTNINQTFRVVATVTAGRVSCHVQGSEVGTFDGPGMIAVTHEATLVVGGGYSISVWCPSEAGGRVRRRDSALIQIQDQRTRDYATLEGTDRHEHPDADAANGLSGTEVITWALRRP